MNVHKAITNFLAFCTKLVPRSEAKFTIGLNEDLEVVRYETVAEEGGEVPVVSVAGKTGAVTLVKGDVGLGNVDNTADLNKPISTATQTALNNKHVKIQIKDETTDLGSAGTVNSIKFTGPDVTASRNADEVTVNITSPVQSVAGKTGDVDLVKADVGLGSVDNTSDTDKPISTLQQVALNAKQVNLQFKDESSNLGSAGTVDSIKFVGAIVAATRLGNEVTVTISGSVDGTTNLGYVPAANNGQVTSSNGTPVTLPGATETEAGLLAAADKAKLNRINKIRTVTVNTTLSATTDETVVFKSPATAAILPTPTNGVLLRVKNLTGANISLTGHLDETSGAVVTVSNLQTVYLHSNGTTWYII